MLTTSSGSTASTHSITSSAIPSTHSSSSSWVCSACTFENTQPDSIRCEICSTYRSSEYVERAASLSNLHTLTRVSSAMSSTTSWVCQSCTYMNRKTRDICKMCHTGTRTASIAATNAALASTAAGSLTPAKHTHSATSTTTTPSSSSYSSSSKRRKGAGIILDDVDDDVDGDGGDDDDGDAEMVDADGDGNSSSLMDLSGDSSLGVTPASTSRKKSSRRVVKAKRSSRTPTSSITPSSATSAALSFMASTPSSLLATFGAPFGGLSLSSVPKFGAAAATSAMGTTASSTKATTTLPCLTNEDSRAELTDDEMTAYYNHFSTVATFHKKYQGKEKEESKDAPETEQEKQGVLKVIKEIYTSLQFKSTSSSSSAAASSSLRAASCQVCFADFDDETQPATLENCHHAQLCRDCFHQYVSIKVKEETVMPWICCPTPQCRHPLTVNDFTNSANLSTAQLAHLAYMYMRKRLVRNECFVSCQTRGCSFGFLILNHKNGKVPKPTKKTCAMCNVDQLVEKGKEGELDDEFKKMIANRTLRPCPKCKHLTMKEKGVCNVLQCLKCSVWWNWKTSETGKDSTTLKNKARAHGTLWEPGELDYQRRLEAQNPEEFKKLLERNGQTRFANNIIRIISEDKVNL